MYVLSAGTTFGAIPPNIMTGVSKPGVDNTLQLIYSPTTDITYRWDKISTPSAQFTVNELNLKFL